MLLFMRRTLSALKLFVITTHKQNHARNPTESRALLTLYACMRVLHSAVAAAYA